MSSLQQLIDRWMQDADSLRRNACDAIATVVERHIAELQAAARADGDTVLTLESAAKESGYSTDRLRHMITEGRVANAGRKGAPRIRRADLPRKAATATPFDARASARRMLQQGDSA